MINQVGDDFGIGLAFKHIAEGFQFVAQLVVVFDDAVMYEGDAVTRKMRMCIVRSGCAVGCPARVRDAGKAAQVFLGNLLFQFRHAGGAACAFQLAVDVQRDAARVVTAVFESFKAFDQNGSDIALSDCADDTAHRNLVVFG
ncbi:hypothetical protein D3C81_1328990 [compost metagenome]